MSALSTAGSIAGIVSGIGIPVGVALVWVARRWIHEQIVIKLSNDDTPVAKYAHDARDNSEAAKQFAEKAYNAVMDTNQMLVDHVTNTQVHRVQR